MEISSYSLDGKLFDTLSDKGEYDVKTVFRHQTIKLVDGRGQ